VDSARPIFMILVMIAKLVASARLGVIRTANLSSGI